MRYPDNRVLISVLNVVHFLKAKGLLATKFSHFLVVEGFVIIT